MNARRGPFVTIACAAALLLVACAGGDAPAPGPPESAAEAGAGPDAPAEPAPEPSAPDVVATGKGPAEASAPPRPSAPAAPERRPQVGAEPTPPAAPPRPAAPEPAPRAEPAPPAPPAPVTAAALAVVDPGGPVEVPAPKAGLTRIGAEKCKVCHKVQFASWSDSAHAKRTPPLDCEDCHGPGSGYKSIAVMKDPDRAQAAGLVMPGKDFCSTCHKAGWTDDLSRRVHAHKEQQG